MVAPRDNHPLIRSWREGPTFHLDVRQLLEQGEEPYIYIMDCIQQLEPGEKLALHALFEPKPLMRQVGRMGYAIAVQRVEPEHWLMTIHMPD